MDISRKMKSEYIGVSIRHVTASSYLAWNVYWFITHM